MRAAFRIGSPGRVLGQNVASTGGAAIGVRVPGTPHMNPNRAPLPGTGSMSCSPGIAQNFMSQYQTPTSGVPSPAILSNTMQQRFASLNVTSQNSHPKTSEQAYTPSRLARQLFSESITPELSEDALTGDSHESDLSSITKLLFPKEISQEEAQPIQVSDIRQLLPTPQATLEQEQNPSVSLVASSGQEPAAPAAESLNRDSDLQLADRLPLQDREEELDYQPQVIEDLAIPNSHQENGRPLSILLDEMPDDIELDLGELESHSFYDKLLDEAYQLLSASEVRLLNCSSHILAYGLRVGFDDLTSEQIEQITESDIEVLTEEQRASLPEQLKKPSLWQRIYAFIQPIIQAIGDFFSWVYKEIAVKPFQQSSAVEGVEEDAAESSEVQDALTPSIELEPASE